MAASNAFGRLLALLGIAFFLATLGGCRLITPAELEKYGTRSYDGRSKAQVMKAVLASFRSQGYEIASQDDDGGRVRTGPKVVVVTAASTGYGTAAATAGELAWTVDVEAQSSGAIVHATPRGYQGGQSIDATRFNYDFARKAFDTLFSEIDAEMPRGGSATLTNAKVVADKKTFTETKTALKKKAKPASPSVSTAAPASNP